MKLTQVTVERFRNFVDAQTIAIEPDLTVLIGKNEAGKTTILKALHRLNPANLVDTAFNLTTEYPRWRLSRDRRQNQNLADQTCPIRAEFVLEPTDIDALGEILPAPPPVGTRCRAWRAYSGNFGVDLRASLDVVVASAAEAAAVTNDDLQPLLAEQTLEAVTERAKDRAKELKDEPDTAARSKALTSFVATAGKLSYLLGKAALPDEAPQQLWNLMPKFFYYSAYQNLPGECDLTDLAAKVAAGEALTARENTVLALLANAGEKPSDFLDENYDSRKAELQAASSELTQHVMEYWTQNPDLAVVFDVDTVPLEGDPPPGVRRILKIEMRDDRHGGVQTNFATRSAGFQWFFSFFAAFSAYQSNPEPIVVLLDEPGTSLHGEAQQDFVRYVQGELAPVKQTLYTTHSQFMLDTSQYEKMRAVDDRATRADPNQGVVVTPISLSADRETILPVESALGQSVSQHLFIGGGHHLLVEGSSDFIYLQRVSEYFLAQGESGLDPHFAVVAVGGSGNMPAFVALMGRRLQVSVLIDGAKSNTTFDRVRAAAEANDIPESAIVTCADADNALPRDADVEDLFAVADYLRLYNWAFGTATTEADLPEGKRILSRLPTFDHALPAHALTDHRDEFFASVSSTTVTRFGKLFELLNATLGT